jgi:hypothetical protein
MRCANHIQEDNMVASDQEGFSDEDIQLAKKVIRVAYGILAAFLTAVAYLAGGPDKIDALSEAVQNALKAVDPFVLTIRWYNKQLWEMGTLDDLTKGGWLGGVLIAAGAVTIYTVYVNAEDKYREPMQKFFLAWLSILASGLVAVPLKWALIVLALVLGKAIGFLFWINAVIAGILEAVMYFKKGKEIVETARAIKERFGRKAS